ncbi:MAG: acyl-ACP thioesterase domain-containing protein [Bacteroidota bacterium]
MRSVTEQVTATHTETFTIRANEINTDGVATLPAICALFQEVAGNHALTLNFDISQLLSQGITWVLYKLDISMVRYPIWRETITIETWPHSGDGFRAYRNFVIRNEHGEEIGHCLSYWLMMDIHTRRPVRLPAEVMDMKFDKRPYVKTIKREQIKSRKSLEPSHSFHVRQSDLDMNNHVNNVAYVGWMLESLEPNTLVSSAEIQYMRESKQGDNIDLSVQQDGENTLFVQLSAQEGVTVALGNFTLG